MKTSLGKAWLAGTVLASMSGCAPTLEPLSYVGLDSNNFSHNANCGAYPTDGDVGTDQQPGAEGNGTQAGNEHHTSGGASTVQKRKPFCVDPNNPDPPAAYKPGVLDLLDARIVTYSQKASGAYLGITQGMYDATITVAAIGAAAVAIFTHGAARANWLAGLGLGAGAAATAWGWANPSSRIDAYRLGLYRAVCVRSAATGLDGSDDALKLAKDDTQQLRTDLVGSVSDLDFVQALESMNGPTAASAARADDAATAAQRAASEALVAAEQERAVYQQRGVLVYTALQKIDAQVYGATKGSTLTYQDAVRTVSQAAAPVPASGTSATARAPASNLSPRYRSRSVKAAASAQQKEQEQQQQRQEAATRKVSANAAALTSSAAKLSTIKPYTTAAKAIGDCTSAAISQ